MRVLSSVIVFGLLCLRCCKSIPLCKWVWYDNGIYKESVVTGGAFYNPITISKTTVKIHMEDVTTIPYISGLTSLQEIWFSQSNISISSGFLEKLPNLMNIYLVDNKRLYIDSGTFQRLNVKSIAIRNNSLSVLEDVTFLNLPKLKYVDLSNNRLTYWNPNGFLKTPNVIELKLVRNKITYIQADAFVKLIKLQTLYLGDNKIERLDENAFRGLNYLLMLDLNTNRIKNLPENLFAPYPVVDVQGTRTLKKKKYESVDLQYNYLSFLPNKVLMDLSETKKINIQLNPWKCACYFKIMNWAQANNVEVVVNSFISPLCIVSKLTCEEVIDQSLLKTFFELCDMCANSKWP